MHPLSKTKLAVITVLSTFSAALFWTLLFFRHPVVSELIWDINTIFFSVVAFFLLLKWTLKPKAIDMVKIYVRLIFRVWLLIFISFSMYQGAQRVGFLLSLSFIFGYLEGLIDLDNWLKNHRFGNRFLVALKHNSAMGSLIILSVFHLSCALILWLFFRYY